MDVLRGRLGALGHPLPVHQHRRRPRRLTRLPRLVAGPARRPRPAAVRLAVRTARHAPSPLALAARLRDRRDLDPLPADRVRRGARQLVRRRDPDRGDAADRRGARLRVRPHRAGRGATARRPDRRLRGRRRARRCRHRRRPRRGDRHDRDPDRGDRLRARADDAAVEALHPRAAGGDGRRPRLRRGPARAARGSDRSGCRPPSTRRT